MTKTTCPKCRRRPVDRSTPSAIRRNKCRECYREYMRAYMAERRAGAPPRSGRTQTRAWKDKNSPEARLDLKKHLAGLIGGGRCAACGWEPGTDREWGALEFHHLDPRTKRFRIAGNHTRKLADLEAEVRKCEIRCVRCHRIEHGPAL